jgi:hypothetical protein
VSGTGAAAIEDQVVGAGRQGAFIKALGPARAPRQPADGLLRRAADAGHGPAQHGLHMGGQGIGVGKLHVAHQAQCLQFLLRQDCFLK